MFKLSKFLIFTCLCCSGFYVLANEKLPGLIVCEETCGGKKPGCQWTGDRYTCIHNQDIAEDNIIDELRQHANEEISPNTEKNKFKVVESSQVPKDSPLMLQVKSETEETPKAAGHSSNAAAAADTVSKPVFVAVVAGCSIAGLVGLVVAGVCWYRLQKNVKAASEAEYPAYGVTGPSQEKAGSPGDRKLAQSAQMYHYQHQKQQMLAMERANGDLGGNGSDAESEEENEEGDYTVYECPGLAPTGEMEVKNPLFNDDTPVAADSATSGGKQN